MILKLRAIKKWHRGSWTLSFPWKIFVIINSKCLAYSKTEISCLKNIRLYMEQLFQYYYYCLLPCITGKCHRLTKAQLRINGKINIQISLWVKNQFMALSMHPGSGLSWSLSEKKNSSSAKEWSILTLTVIRSDIISFIIFCFGIGAANKIEYLYSAKIDWLTFCLQSNMTFPQRSIGLVYPK